MSPKAQRAEDERHWVGAVNDVRRKKAEWYAVSLCAEKRGQPSLGWREKDGTDVPHPMPHYHHLNPRKRQHGNPKHV